MRVNISSLRGHKGSSFKVEEELPGDFALSYSEVESVKGPVKVRLVVTNNGEGYLVAGDLELEVGLRCSRCLKPFAKKLTAYVEEEIFNALPQGRDDEPFEDEVPLVDGSELNLTGLIQESLVMSIPMKAVCRDDCPGLCPACGAVLAEEECGCPSPGGDIRLAPLKELLEASGEEPRERRKGYGGTKEKTLKGKN